MGLLLLVPAAAVAWWLLRRGPEPVRPAADAIVTQPAPAASAEPPVHPAPSAIGGDVPELSAKMTRAAELRRTNPKARRALLREVVARDPNHLPALEALSLALLHDENHAEARSFADRCLALEPGNETCRMVANYALPKTEGSEAFAEEARACLQNTPDDPKCLASTIGHDVLVGDDADAEALTLRLEKVAPGTKQTLLARARVESLSGHYEEARRALEGACRQGMEQACFRADALRDEGW